VIGWRWDDATGHAVVVTAIDNLGKGASGQAVQCFNLMLGLPETTALDAPALQLVAAILIAHVGMDRMLGYGLKLPSSFQDTHLGRIGRGRA